MTLQDLTKATGIVDSLLAIFDNQDDGINPSQCMDCKEWEGHHQDHCDIAYARSWLAAQVAKRHL